MFQPDLKFEFDILSTISEEKGPVGASFLKLLLEVPQATIGRKLQELEYRGYLKKESNKGRVLTDEGKEYVKVLEGKILKIQNAEELIKDPVTFSKERLLDILKVRKILEKESAYLATINMTDSYLQQLKELVDLQYSKVSQGLLGDDEDFKFHILLAKISGNKVLEQILTLILSQKKAYSEFSYIRKKVSSTFLQDHKIILDVIAKGDAEKAGNLVVAHIDQIIDDLHKYFEQKDEKGD